MGNTTNRSLGLAARTHAVSQPNWKKFTPFVRATSWLAGIVVGRLLSIQLDAEGIVPINRCIPPEELIWELENSSLEVWWEPHQATGWQTFDLSAYEKRRNGGNPGTVH